MEDIIPTSFTDKELREFNKKYGFVILEDPCPLPSPPVYKLPEPFIIKVVREAAKMVKKMRSSPKGHKR